MSRLLPLISIVTPSFNQGRYLSETLQSLVDQQYPSLEVIIQDGGSQDDSIVIAQRYVRQYPNIFHLSVAKDKGQAHALNLGFAKTRGEILGVLNSDDTLYPGCLNSVAREISPARGRFVVFGRSLFTGEDSPYVGVEHPAEFESHFDHLAIWKRGFNTIPQPSTFWHRHVWETCGGFDETESHVLDYDLFCRFSRHFHFHRVDELWSTYRMHAVSKSAQRTEAEVLAMSVAVSRRNWPLPWHPLRWRLAMSHWFYEHHAYERARHHARRAEQAFAEGRPARALGELTRTLALSPRMAWRRLCRPALASCGLDWLEKLVWSHGAQPEGFTGRYPDGWIGPYYRQELPVPGDAQRLHLRMQHNPQPNGAHAEIHIELRLNANLCKKKSVTAGGPFEIKIDLTPYRNKTCLLELQSRPYFVPSAHEGSTDERKLTVLLMNVEVQRAALAM